jgi:mRNA interferase RelE/StbE
VTYRIEMKPTARKALRDLSRDMVARIDAAILALAETPRPPGCVKMAGREAWRIRVGDYRVIYEIHDGILVVVVLELGHRRQIYR